MYGAVPPVEVAVNVKCSSVETLLGFVEQEAVKEVPGSLGVVDCSSTLAEQLVIAIGLLEFVPRDVITSTANFSPIVLYVLETDCPACAIDPSLSPQ